jgi:hypothetical protein
MPTEPSEGPELCRPNEQVALELSYSLGPLGEGGMASWFRSLEGNIAAHTPEAAGLNLPPADADSTRFGGILDEKRKGMEVKVSMEHIIAPSYHSRQQHTIVYSTILGEYVEHDTITPMFLVDFGGGLDRVRVPQSTCSFPIGGEPSVGGASGAGRYPKTRVRRNIQLRPHALV